ncbi:MAG: hypothetical protein ACLP6E_14745 [Acidimicrobiales bacterium]
MLGLSGSEVARRANRITGRSTKARNRLWHGSRWAMLVVGVISPFVLVARTGTAHATTASSPNWKILPTPNEGTGDNRLGGVSCHSLNACVSVGYYLDSSGNSQTLAESWNGTAWTLTSSPNKGNDGDQLNAVSCLSSSNCVAVGTFDTTAGRYQSLIESWNGTTWSVTPSPDPSEAFDYLSGVSCVGPTFCVAVGESGKDYSKTLIVSWNGTIWSLATSPDPGAGNALSGVSCVSKSNCVAVGTLETTAGRHKTLVESWNGTTWSVTPSPNRASDSLYGVSCTKTRCMAVGSYFSGGRAQPLTESWNGTVWSKVESPSFNKSTVVTLNAVSCSSSTHCVAVGGYDEVLIESWNGAEWSVTKGPDKGNGSWLYGVSCAGTGSCTAVGFFTTTKGADRNLVEAAEQRRRGAADVSTVQA